VALNPAPDTDTPDIVTFEFPLLVSVVLNELLLPTFTFPKLRLEVLSPSPLVAATPVPLTEMIDGELGASLTSMIDPVTLRAALGPNTALNVAVLPAAIASGAVIPVVLKPAPVTATEEIVRVSLLPFVSLMVCELFVPIATFPNAAEVGVAASCGGPWSDVFAELVYPAQLESPTIARIIASVVASTTGVAERATVAGSCGIEAGTCLTCSWKWALISRSV
jgi:hypothetical protein